MCSSVPISLKHDNNSVFLVTTVLQKDSKHTIITQYDDVYNNISWKQKQSPTYHSRITTLSFMWIIYGISVQCNRRAFINYSNSSNFLEYHEGAFVIMMNGHICILSYVNKFCLYPCSILPALIQLNFCCVISNQWLFKKPYHMGNKTILKTDCCIISLAIPSTKKGLITSRFKG